MVAISASAVVLADELTIAPAEQQPGDIVIYYWHAGIYAGDGMMIHSPYPGTSVSYEEVHSEDIQDIRRII